MIDRLMREAAAESDQKMFCDTEMAKSRGKQKDLAARADMHSVRIEKTEAGMAKLKEAISTLTTEISEIDAGMKEATDLRMQQKTEFDASSAEYKQSADAVANAIQVLQSYYSSGSFVRRARRRCSAAPGPTSARPSSPCSRWPSRTSRSCSRRPPRRRPRPPRPSRSCRRRTPSPGRRRSRR